MGFIISPCIPGAKLNTKLRTDVVECFLLVLLVTLFFVFTFAHAESYLFCSLFETLSNGTLIFKQILNFGFF